MNLLPTSPSVSFSPPGKKYNLKVVTSDLSVLIIPRTRVISLVHKCTRQSLTSVLVDLITWFYDAAIHQEMLTGTRAKGSEQGAITNFNNRIATSAIEEGVVLHLTRQERLVFVS